MKIRFVAEDARLLFACIERGKRYAENATPTRYCPICRLARQIFVGADSGTGEGQAPGGKKIGLDHKSRTSQPLLGFYAAADRIIHHRSLGNLGALEHACLLILR